MESTKEIVQYVYIPATAHAPKTFTTLMNDYQSGAISWYIQVAEPQHAKLKEDARLFEVYADGTMKACANLSIQKGGTGHIK